MVVMMFLFSLRLVKKMLFCQGLREKVSFRFFANVVCFPHSHLEAPNTTTMLFGIKQQIGVQVSEAIN